MEKKVDTPPHYQSAIQPIDYIVANDMNFFSGNALKYLTRYKKKNGEEDILKAIHYCTMILKYEYGWPDEDIHNIKV